MQFPVQNRGIAQRSLSESHVQNRAIDMENLEVNLAAGFDYSNMPLSSL